MNIDHMSNVGFEALPKKKTYQCYFLQHKYNMVDTGAAAGLISSVLHGFIDEAYFFKCSLLLVQISLLYILESQYLHMKLPPALSFLGPLACMT